VLSQAVPVVVHCIVPVCHEFSQSPVMSSIAKDDHLFKIYQSDFTKN
jgi:hypothetical protein